MSIIKKSEFKQMNEAQLGSRLDELHKELLKLNTQLSTHTTPENPGRVRLVKKTIARILMLRHARKLEKKIETKTQASTKVSEKKKHEEASTQKKEKKDRVKTTKQEGKKGKGTL